MRSSAYPHTRYTQRGEVEFSLTFSYFGAAFSIVEYDLAIEQLFLVTNTTYLRTLQFCERRDFIRMSKSVFRVVVHSIRKIRFASHSFDPHSLAIRHKLEVADAKHILLSIVRFWLFSHFVRKSIDVRSIPCIDPDHRFDKNIKEKPNCSERVKQFKVRHTHTHRAVINRL